MSVLLAANTACPPVVFQSHLENLAISMASLEPFKQGCIDKEGLSAK